MFSNKYILFLLPVLLLSCSRYPHDVERALKLAGDNRAELEKVLDYYSEKPADSLKYKAACFLIANMPGHASVSALLKDRNNRIYEGFIADGHVYDSLITKGYRLEKTIEPDVRFIGCNFLIGQIDLAFEAWAGPWSRNTTFDDFCRYILPYRAQNEPLSAVRGELLRTYGMALDTVPGLTCPVEACGIINRILQDSIRYLGSLMKVPVSRSAEDTKNNGVGQCDDMCNFGIYVMRALGIPVAAEKTLWARTNAGHSWCSVLDTTGVWHGFGPGEIQPGGMISHLSERLYRTPAKIYRVAYERRKDARLDSLLRHPVPPGMFAVAFSRDVTGEYVPTPVVHASVDTPEVYSFLCVFNYGAWKAVDYAPVKSGQSSFRVGADIIYMNHVFRDGNLYPCGEPFLLKADGVEKLIPDFDRPCALTLTKKNIGGDRLLYWDITEKMWKGLTCSGSSETELFFDNVPGNALLWHYTPGHPQRIGIVENGKYVSH